MAASFDYTKVNLYEILDLQIDASEKEIIKAYRKKALKYHPDKNPDPACVEVFHKLSKALEVLTNESTRASYDKILKAREAAAVRHKQLDSKRRKLREDLEAREAAALSEEQQRAQQNKNLKDEIERLRKEGSSLLEREQALLKEEIARQLKETSLKKTADDGDSVRLRLKWKCPKTDENNGGYNSQILTQIFSQYGSISTLLVSGKKKGSAVIEYNSVNESACHIEEEKGLPSSPPLTVTLISGQLPKPGVSQTSSNTEGNDAHSSTVTDSFTQEPADVKPPTQQSGLTSDQDFESLVMMKLRQAEERKRLIEQLRNQDDEEEEDTKSKDSTNET